MAQCGLVHDLTEPNHREGDTASFTVGCADAGDNTLRFQVQGARRDASLNTRTGAFEWFTDGRDGGAIELTFGAEDSGQDDFAETIRVLAVGRRQPHRPQRSGTGAHRRHRRGWTASRSHRLWRRSEPGGPPPALVTVRGQQVKTDIKIRGSTRLGYPKKSFTIGSVNEELEVDESGDRSRGHMVLTSAFDDNSYARQNRVYDMWAAMADSLDAERLTPRAFFLVVSLNGLYRGLCLCSDRIDDEFIRHMGLGGDGDLLKAVPPSASYDFFDEDGVAKATMAQGWGKAGGRRELRPHHHRHADRGHGELHPRRIRRPLRQMDPSR